MDLRAFKKINDILAPLSRDVGGKADPPGADSSASMFGWVKDIHRNINQKLSDERLSKLDNLGDGMDAVNDGMTTLEDTVGAKTDAAGTLATSSLFSWLKGVYNAVSSGNTSLSTIDGKIGASSASASATGTNLFALIKFIAGRANSGGMPVVKKVQRGVALYVRNKGSLTISISSINVSKSLVLLEGTGGYNQDSRAASGYAWAYNVDPYVTSLSSTSIVLVSAEDSISQFFTFSWQVIEFY